ncbi:MULTISPECIES: hypothetical protein [Roseivirga]|uniref:TonB C-terminal domain-containing protein n=1 Tax=Roseivirga spongicola TaxID=333140 RepID=A0A150X4K1_9BACT|nr:MULTISPECIES: hypothetical protein [Roseivirga]KYG73650.1 hypothetical protein AWW68_13250 [Roseivirga spongicola]MBO6659921.1 hypothetical protein [Roseivirga sp.]MBO6907342.1 hypothetical protein [Roseivirga sp.]WPZ09717.1 hypothetical protein T7867_15745 [Roseivirga spongicola]
MSEQEKKDKRFSIVVSAIVHSSIIALFLVLVAWREPDPPIPEYGIELNLGFQEVGSGDTEKTFDAPAEETENDTPPDAESDSENTEVEEVQEEEVTEPETVEEIKPVTPPVEETKTETPPVEQTVKETITSPEKAEVKVEEKTPPVTETKKEEETKPTEQKKTEEKPVEEKKVEEKPVEKPKPKPTIDNRALMGGKKTNTDSKEAASNNQGSSSEKGNEGDPKGNPNTKGSSPGGADLGVSYSLDGWKWQAPPSKKDDSQVDGVIKFAIDVDDRGKVLRVTVVPGTTISDNTIVDFYKKQVLELRFIQTDASKAPAAVSKGEVTFVIKTN